MIAYLLFSLTTAMSIILLVHRIKNLRLPYRLILLGITLMILLYPFSHYPLAIYWRGIANDFSLSTTVILLRGLFAKKQSPSNNTGIITILLLIGWAVEVTSAYPNAWLMPYRYGFQPHILLILFSGLLILQYCRQQWWWCVAGIASLTAYLFHILPSDNWWDYIMDPWLLLGTTLWWLVQCFKARPLDSQKASAKD